MCLADIAWPRGTLKMPPKPVADRPSGPRPTPTYPRLMTLLLNTGSPRACLVVGHGVWEVVEVAGAWPTGQRYPEALVPLYG